MLCENLASLVELMFEIASSLLLRQKFTPAEIYRTLIFKNASGRVLLYKTRLQFLQNFVSKQHNRNPTREEKNCPAVFIM